MSPLDDQHVAGLVMALEQSIVMGIALAWLFARMLSESEEEERRAERYSDESRAPSST
jgi:putative membrane protein